MKTSPPTLLAAAVVALAAPGAWAQSGASPTQTLRQVTVTGSTIDDRFGDSAREPTSTVSLSGRKIEAQHADNLVQVLKAIPGVTIDTQGGDDLKIKFRGVENQRYMGEKPGVAIVIDGVPVFERTGKVNINLDNIESIKVIKGGASYLFGEDALAGAVVITTKRGATNKGIAIETDVGAYGYQRELARIGHASDEWSGHLQVSRRQADDYHFQSNYRSEALAGNLRWLLDGHADLTLGVEKEDRFRDKHGTVTGVTQAALDPKGTLGRDYARHFDVDLERVNLTYSNDLSEHTNLLALAYQYRDHTRFWSAPQRFSVSGAPISSPDAYTLFNDYHQTQRGVKSELRTTMGTVAWMGGVEFKRNEYLNRTHAMVGFRNSPSPMERPTAAGTVFTDDRTGENVQAIYGEGQWRLATDWTLTGNLRHDRIELDYDARPVTGNSHSTIAERKTFDATSARLGLSWSGLANTVLFGNLSTGFRAPTVDQLYRGSQSPSGSVANNPDLRTERATNVEIGMRKTFTLLEREASLQAAVFQIDRRDFILDSNGQYGNSSAAHIARYENIGGARSRGLELALQSAISPAWSWDLAYTYLDASFTRYDQFLQSQGNPRGMPAGTGACAGPSPNWNNCYRLVPHNNTGNQVPRVPPHVINLRTSWKPDPAWKLSAELDYRATAWADDINQEKWPGRTVFNLMADYRRKTTWLGGATLSAFVRVDNVFNKRHYTIARGTNDAQSYATNFRYDGRYNAEDLSITVDPGRVWRAGLALRF